MRAPDVVGRGRAEADLVPRHARHAERADGVIRQLGVTPPSRLILWPVTKADDSDARDSAAPTRSSGVSARGTHCMAMMRSFCCGVTVLRSISVKVAPGRMALTVML